MALVAATFKVDETCESEKAKCVIHVKSPLLTLNTHFTSNKL